MKKEERYKGVLDWFEANVPVAETELHYDDTEDQSKLADFQNSDFIAAENRKVEFNNPTLEFTHRTARVAIELKPGTGFTSVDGATVSHIGRASCRERV